MSYYTSESPSGHNTSSQSKYFKVTIMQFEQFCNLLIMVCFLIMILKQGLLQSLEGSSLASDPNIRVVALYDNEEVSW